MVVAAHCPCGSGKVLAECCGQYHAGVPAPDPQSLMRSRYTAYVLGLETYLLATWHEDTRPAELGLEAALKWQGLDVRSFSIEGDEGRVCFVARYKVNGRAGRMSETSRFLRENGCWLYVDGAVDEV